MTLISDGNIPIGRSPPAFLGMSNTYNMFMLEGVKAKFSFACHSSINTAKPLSVRSPKCLGETLFAPIPVLILKLEHTCANSSCSGSFSVCHASGPKDEHSCSSSSSFVAHILCHAPALTSASSRGGRGMPVTICLENVGQQTPPFASGADLLLGPES